MSTPGAHAIRAAAGSVGKSEHLASLLEMTFGLVGTRLTRHPTPDPAVTTRRPE
jgi:hypothetical protein